MPNLQGMGGFTKGFAGGIKTGMTFDIRKQVLGEEKKRTALHQQQIDLIGDSKQAEIAMKVIDKNTDPEALQPYLDKLQWKTFLFGPAIQSYATAEASKRKSIKDSMQEINELFKNPTSNVFSKTDLIVPKLKALYGDDPLIKGVDSQVKASKEAYAIDVTPGLVKKITDIHNLLEIIENGNQPGTNGLLQTQPTYTPEQIQALKVEEIRNSLEFQRLNPKGWESFAKRYGLETKPTKKWEEGGYGKKELINEKGEIIATRNVPVKPEKKEKSPKITGNVGINPATGKEEYINTNGSFSGIQPGVKPKAEKKPDIAQQAMDYSQYKKAEIDAGRKPKNFMEWASSQKKSPTQRSLKPDGKGGYIYQ